MIEKLSEIVALLGPFCAHELDIFREQLNSGTLRHQTSTPFYCEKSAGLFILKEIHLFVQSHTKKKLLFVQSHTKDSFLLSKSGRKAVNLQTCSETTFFVANLVTLCIMPSLANVHDERFEGIFALAERPPSSASETLLCTKNPAF